jgi:hypothetical protein
MSYEQEDTCLELMLSGWDIDLHGCACRSRVQCACQILHVLAPPLLLLLLILLSFRRRGHSLKKTMF